MHIRTCMLIWAVCLLVAGVAFAEPIPNKLSRLREKESERGAGADPKVTAQALRERIGVPAKAPLSIRHEWTREVVIVPPAGEPVAHSPEEISRFLRCRFTDRTTKMDARLIGFVVQAATAFGATYAEVISGYRSDKHNLWLRKKGHEVAKDSAHTHGTAIDFRLAEVQTAKLRDWVKSQKWGGVGFYPHSEFVHADVERIRYWKGK